MDTRFIADGKERILQSSEFQENQRVLREMIAARHAAELLTAGFWGRCRVRWHMAAEYRRESRHLWPSAHSLYSSAGDI